MFTSIRGVKGDKGNTGNPGAKGDTGDTGPQGIQGEKGDPYVPDPTWGDESLIFTTTFKDGEYSAVVNLLTDEYLGCFVFVDAYMFGIDIDDLIIVLEGSLDGWSFDSNDAHKYRLSHTIQDSRQSFHVEGYPYFRIYGYSESNTDTIPTTITVRPHR